LCHREGLDSVAEQIAGSSVVIKTLVPSRVVA
jgi:hypothetical protein